MRRLERVKIKDVEEEEAVLVCDISSAHLGKLFLLLLRFVSMLLLIVLVFLLEIQTILKQVKHP